VLLRLLTVALVFVSVGGTAFGAHGTSATSAPCGLHLSPAERGETPFRIPPGGRAVRHVLAGRFALCVVLRSDGTRFAMLERDDEGHVLDAIFYDPSGALRSSADSAYAAARQQAAKVSCGSSSHTAIGNVFWRTTRKWWIGAVPSGLNRDAVVKAIKNAQSEWTNNINWCGIKDQANPPSAYEGKTATPVKRDGKSVIDWGSLANDQDCSGALACALTWYDPSGAPVESDIRFNTKFKWSTTGSPTAADIQTIAAHEIGHVLQLNHVTSATKNDQTTLLWPYFADGDVSGRKLGRGDALADNSHY
jgi:hypothetical protein